MGKIKGLVFKKTKRKEPVFGVAVPYEADNLPEFVVEGLKFIEQNGLHVEGLFRIPGDNAVMQKVKKKLEKGYTVDFSSLNNVHSVAGLLKMYFRELPEPLLTFEHYNMFIAATGKFHQKFSNA